ncbi:hypothetical protein [Alkalicoccobacillus murimartini]|uniref:Uncharacterized protein n=1 Tax=Alkalicoccobacillus murimartini TaxID=171685 RepID=A0ABT9YMS5_9BACI|nr:hypothetical protein [Alkalicoccobacillus murimartini]MDQ0208944.1 hypothetical protein [Alkalicoccobacillus murimartini]
MLYIQPTISLMSLPSDLTIKNNEISVSFIQFERNIDSINIEFEGLKKYLLENCHRLNKDLEEYNSDILKVAKGIFDKRKESILKTKEIESTLTVPLKRSHDVADTFSIPISRPKKAITIRPNVKDQVYKPEPSLDHQTYLDILKIINDMGKGFERKPSVYIGKGEEDLRDHYLMQLEPHFEGSATGETFNKI